MTETKSETPWLLVLVAICGIYFVANQPPKAAVDRDQVQIPVGPLTPAQAELQRVLKASADREAVAAIGRLYSAFGDVLSRSGELQSSQLRAWLVDADTYHFEGTDLVGKVPGFGAAKDAVFSEAVGMEDRMLTAADLTKLVNVCRTISQICEDK